MKKTLSISTALLITLNLQAQSITPALSFPQKMQQHIYGKHNSKLKTYIQQILNSQNIVSAEKPTGTKQRVIGQYFYDNTGELNDSTHYYYLDPTRGSEYNFGNLIYNTHHEEANPPIYTFEELGNNLPQTKMAAKADRIENYIESLYEPVKTTIAHYNAQKNIDTLDIVYDGGGEQQKSIRYYNSQGYPTSIVFWDDTGDTVLLHKIGYNTSFTQVLSDTAYYYSNNQPELEYVLVSQYHYTNNNLTSVYLLSVDLVNSMMDTLGRSQFTYTSDNKLTVTTLEEYLGDDVFQLNQKDSLVYLPTIAYPVADYYTEYYNNELDYGVAYIKTIGTNGLPTDIVIKEPVIGQPGQWQQTGSGNYIYNSYQNPTFIKFFNPVDVNDTITLAFKYEEYDEVGIKDLNTLNGVSVYPNPAKDYINVSMKENSTAITQTKIIDINGKVVFEKESKNVSQKISIAPFPAGIYLLQITNSGNMYQQKIVKQ